MPEMSKKKIGLFFGSFNPIHVGHLIIANYMADQTDLDQVWLVVSPHNPLKKKNSLARDFDRLHLVRLAIENNLNLQASNIEFDLPKPSYTIDTLTYLKEKHPEDEFVLIMGSDNIENFHKWKNYELILKLHSIYIYMRPGHDKNPYEEYDNVRFHHAPLMRISSSYIRNCIANGHSVQYLLTEPVFDYIQNSGMYPKLAPN